ncbi:MAG: hypothetical protein RQM95_03835 [Syntrophaceticus schinkii]
MLRVYAELTHFIVQSLNAISFSIEVVRLLNALDEGEPGVKKKSPGVER